MLSLIKGQLLKQAYNVPLLFQIENFHLTGVVAAWQSTNQPRKWLKYNKVIYPPQLPDEERRPAVSNTY